MTAVRAMDADTALREMDNIVDSAEIRNSLLALRRVLFYWGKRQVLALRAGDNNS
jgi:hypothetical protein